MQYYQRIKDLREDHDLTQEKLCEELFISRSTYTYYEYGKHSVPLDFAVNLADFYGVTLDYLAGRTNIKEKFVSDRIKKERLKENTSQKEEFAKDLFTYDELQLIEHYRTLTERNKGKLEQFLDTLIENQKS